MSSSDDETKTDIYDSKKFDCSKPVNIGKLLNDFINVKLPIIETENVDILNENNVFNDIIKNGKQDSSEKNSQDIDIELLSSPGDLHRVSSEHITSYQTEIKTWKGSVSENDTLQVLKHSYERNNLPEYKRIYVNRFLKYRTHITTGFNKENITKTDLTTIHGECVITIHIYEPFLHSSTGGTLRRPRAKFSHEIHVLGSNLLTDFRDCIRCSQDKDTGKDISSDPEQDTSPESGGPCIMYMQGIVFYDDRYSANEYANELEKWGNRKNILLKSSPMSNVKFTDLTVRFGFPQMYQHRGYCEHLIVFSNMEFVKPGRCLDVNNFPMLVKIAKRQYLLCKLCDKNFASWVIRDSNSVPYRELLWCTSCMIRYNYIGDVEERVGDFRCYRYNV